MHFPESPRVVFQTNPLAEVVCQLTFPRLFEIDQELPVEFQKKIRSRFPIVSSANRLEIEVNADDPTRSIQKMTPSYLFTDTSGELTVTLTSSFVALTASKYESWETFRSALELALEAARRVYEIPFFVRVGLRYKDIIDRAALGIDLVQWRELLRPEIIGLAGAEAVQASDVVDFSSTSVLRLSRGHLRLNAGLVRRSDQTSSGFLIDSDFWSDERVEAKPDVCFDLLDRYNKEAGNLFRWCIMERLKQALSTG